jgi:hypothetical protein
LLTSVPTLEVELLRTMSSDADALKPIDWAEAATAVYLPIWEKLVSTESAALQSISVNGLPAAMAAEHGIASRMRSKGGEQLNVEQRRARAIAVAGAALAVLLHRQGWRLSALPGEPVELQRDSSIVKPFDLVRGLADKNITEEVWGQMWAQAGIGVLQLHSAAALACTQ